MQFSTAGGDAMFKTDHQKLKIKEGLQNAVKYIVITFF